VTVVVLDRRGVCCATIGHKVRGFPLQHPDEHRSGQRTWLPEPVIQVVYDGEWLSLVEHLDGGQEVGRSNRLSPTIAAAK
jgi:hypothetical protein